MFDRFFGPKTDGATAAPPAAPAAAPDPSGDTATVRRIVANLEAMPPERARLVASAAYTLARAAHADLDISDDEVALIEHELQTRGALDEPTAVLVAEMAKLQAKTVGGTEDYVVTREFNALATHDQRVAMVAACFAISAVSGSISAEESAEVNQIANELGLDAATVSGIRAEYHEHLSSVQAVRRLATQSE